MQNHKDEIIQKVIKSAKKMFLQQGIRRVTMDDISHKLHMSKRTIYELFEDKEDLLIACYKYDMKEQEEILNKLLKTCDNVITVLLHRFKLSLEFFQRASETFLDDLPRYKKLNEYIIKDRENYKQKAVSFLQKGVQQGLLIPEINYEIIQSMCLKMSDTSARCFACKKYSPEEIIRSTVFAYIRGCTTEKGRAFMDDFLTQ